MNLWTSRSGSVFGVFFKKINAFLVFSVCFHKTVYNKWCFIVKIVGKIENDLESGFVKQWINYTFKYLALNVLCWMKRETACRSSTWRALSEVFCTSIRTLSTSLFASLNVTFFADVPFSPISKASKRYPKVFKKWNCFRKTGLDTS